MDKNMLLLTSVLVYVPAGTTVKTDPHSYIEQVSKTHKIPSKAALTEFFFIEVSGCTINYVCKQVLSHIFCLHRKIYVEDFTLKQLLPFQICAREIYENLFTNIQKQ